MKWFGRKWKPREKLIYKSWSKGDSHFGKAAYVTIIRDNQPYEGTFKVQDGKCEIHVDSCEFITPIENCTFSKKITIFDSIYAGGLGQNGYYEKQFRYILRIHDVAKLIEL